MAKITNKVAKPATPTKTAAKPAVKKEKNPDSFLNKFSMPVIKLGLVGALTAGVIGLTNELTKDSIADNWYEFSLSSYMELGESVEGWERDGDNFKIITEGTSGGVSEYMVYCDTAENCAEDEIDSDAIIGYTFKYDGAVSTHGDMSMQITTMVENNAPVMVDYKQLGFVHSFGTQASQVLAKLDQMAEDRVEIVSGAFPGEGISGSTATIGTLDSAFGDIRTTFDAVAVNPATGLSEKVDSIVELGSIADHDALKTKIEASTTEAKFIIDNDVLLGAKLADDEYVITVNWLGYRSYSTEIMFYIKSDGSFEWASLNKLKFASEGAGLCDEDDCGHSEVVSWLDTTSADIDSMTEGTISGSSTTETKAGMKALYNSLDWFWTNKEDLFNV